MEIFNHKKLRLLYFEGKINKKFQLTMLRKLTHLYVDFEDLDTAALAAWQVGTDIREEEAIGGLR